MICGLIAAIMVIGVVGGVLALRPSAGEAAPEAADSTSTPITAERGKHPPTEPMTVQQELAVSAARSSVRSLGISRMALIQRLLDSGYSEADAGFAVEHVDADWSEEAALAARTRLAAGSFTPGELHNQLVFDGFTEAEIQDALAAAQH